MRRMNNILIFTGVVLLLVISVPLGVTGQDKFPSLYIEDLQGIKAISSAILVTGKVVNPLPWDVADVEVVVLFEEDPLDPIARDTIDRIPSGKSADFAIEKTSDLDLSTFRAGVIGYTLLSDDVSDLLDLYHATDNLVLQAAVARAFNKMSANALPALLECIEARGRSDELSLEQVYNDLMCLNALAALGDPDAVQPLLELLAWYDQINELDLLTLKLEIYLDEYNPLNELSILEDFDYLDGSMTDLVNETLTSVGTSGVADLLRATHSQSQIVQEIAQSKLAALNKVTVEALLDESDPTILADIIAALGEVKRVQAVVPLLELAQANDSLVDAVDHSVLEMGAKGVPSLASALYHSSGAVADHAEQLLRQEAEQVVPELERALSSQGKQSVPTDAKDADTLVTTLRELADAQINAEIDDAFERGWSLFEAGDCEEAAEVIESMFEIRNTTTRHAAQVAQVYQCQANTLAENGAYSQAIALSLQAERLDPNNTMARINLANWFTIQGEIEYNAGQVEKAVTLFQSTLERDPNNPIARRFLGRVVLRTNLLYLLTGAASLVTFVTVSSHQSKTRR